MPQDFKTDLKEKVYLPPHTYAYKQLAILPIQLGIIHTVQAPLYMSGRAPCYSAAPSQNSHCLYARTAVYRASCGEAVSNAAQGYGCPALSMPRRPVQRKTKNANFLAPTHDPLPPNFGPKYIPGAPWRAIAYRENLEVIDALVH